MAAVEEKKECIELRKSSGISNYGTTDNLPQSQQPNVIEVNDGKKDTTIEQLHDAFKLASKGKRKAMLDKFNKENPN